MSKKASNQYGEDFILEDRDELDLKKVERIKKATDWMPEEDTDLFMEVRNESHNYSQARGLLTNMIATILNNSNVNYNVDAWKTIYEAYLTIINSDWLGEHEKRLLEEWFKPQLDKLIVCIKNPEIMINPLNEFEMYAEQQEKAKVKTLKNNRK